MVLELALLLFFTTSFVTAKVYDRCELAYELKYTHKFPGYEIPTWVCIAAHESLYDTAAMNPGSGDHGLFQISELFWCSPPGFACNTPCDSFRDDDITDDVQCIRRIHKEHTRISGDGFNAWVVYPLYCTGDTSTYIRGCFENEIDNNIDSGDFQSPNYTVSSENPLDEDDDGYEFPPLPSSPKKTSENIITSDYEFYEFPPLPTLSKDNSTGAIEQQANESSVTRIQVEDTVTTVTSSEANQFTVAASMFASKSEHNDVTLNPSVKLPTQTTSFFSATTLTTHKIVSTTSKPISLGTETNLRTSTSDYHRKSTFTPALPLASYKKSSVRKPKEREMPSVFHVTPSPRQITIKPFPAKPEIIFTLKPSLSLPRPIKPVTMKPPNIRPPSNRPLPTSPSRRPTLNLPKLGLRPHFQESTTGLDQQIQLSTAQEPSLFLKEHIASHNTSFTILKPLSPQKPAVIKSFYTTTKLNQIAPSTTLKPQFSSKPVEPKTFFTLGNSVTPQITTKLVQKTTTFKPRYSQKLTTETFFTTPMASQKSSLATFSTTLKPLFFQKPSTQKTHTTVRSLAFQGTHTTKLAQKASSFSTLKPPFPKKQTTESLVLKTSLGPVLEPLSSQKLLSKLNHSKSFSPSSSDSSKTVTTLTPSINKISSLKREERKFKDEFPGYIFYRVGNGFKLIHKP